jgi:hypothetical protein
MKGEKNMELSTLLEGLGYIGSGMQLIVDLVQVNVDGAGWIASAFTWVSENLQGIIDLVGSLAG